MSTISMKSFKKIIALSATNHFIVQEEGTQELKECGLQGFKINQTHAARALFNEFIGKTIECSYSKNGKDIRYPNESFIANLLSKNAISVVKKQLQQCKVYTSEQKQKFLLIQAQKNQASSIIDFSQDRKQLIKRFKNCSQKIKGKIEYLSQQVLISFVQKDTQCFLSGKLRNIRTFFALLPQQVFWDNLLTHEQVQIEVFKPKFSLQRKRYEIQISLGEVLQNIIISRGFGIIQTRNLTKLSKQTYEQKIDKQIISRNDNKGVYKNNAQMLAFIYAKDNFVGIVTDIIDGYIFEISKLKNKELIKVQLSAVICPIGDEPGSTDCREFARKNLIGKQVNVYLTHDEGLNITGSVIRSSDWKDIQFLMLQNGLAFIRQELRGSIIATKYQQAEKSAKIKSKGLHRKQIGNKRYQDLTVPIGNNKIQQKQYFHRRLDVLASFDIIEDGVIEEFIDVITYKVRIQSKNICIKFRLDNVLKPTINPNIQEAGQIKEITKKFMYYNLKKRSVTVQINDYQKQTNCFLGVMKITELFKKQLQQILIEQSLVYADKYNINHSYLNIQEKVKVNHKNIWSPKLKCFEPINLLDEENFCFEGKFSWALRGRTVFIQPKSRYENLEKIQKALQGKNQQALKHQKIMVNAWCAAPYDGQIYRALIRSIKHNKITVQFMDWGNIQTVNAADLKQLPVELLYLQRQSIRANLNMIKYTKQEQAQQKVREILLQGQYVFKKVYGDLVDVYDGEIYMNFDLIEKGVLKADPITLKNSDQKQIILQLQDHLRKQRIGIWQDSQGQESQVDNYLYYEDK